MTNAADRRQIVAALGPAGDEARSRREAPLTDVVDQAQRDLREALAAAGAALQRVDEAYDRFRALAAAPVSSAPDLELIEPRRRRRYRAAENEEWMHVASAAFELGVSRTTAWRWAKEQWAQWPYTAQQVDINRLRHLRPPRGKNAKIGK